MAKRNPSGSACAESRWKRSATEPGGGSWRCTASRRSIGKRRFLDLLARHGEVIAPSNPGFGNSPRPKDFDTVYDLVHLYLDLIDALPGDKVTLIGFSFGGWLAAEVAAACSHRLDKLVLVDPLGHQNQRSRDAGHPRHLQQIARRGCAGAAGTTRTAFAPDFNSMSDEALVVYARNREALCLYAWHPYMYNPQLPRWLGRINVPTLAAVG